MDNVTKDRTAEIIFAVIPPVKIVATIPQDVAAGKGYLLFQATYIFERKCLPVFLEFYESIQHWQNSV